LLALLANLIHVRVIVGVVLLIDFEGVLGQRPKIFREKIYGTHSPLSGRRFRSFSFHKLLLLLLFIVICRLLLV
jgi:hypothetical protein